jgi:molybdopterin-containing oxidoreductase family membrane subunit
MNKRATGLRVAVWVMVILGLFAGTYGLIDRIQFGHLHAGYGSYVPWGLWVAGYIYLIGLSAGAFLLSTLVYVFRIKVFESIGKLALLIALTTLLGALFLIWIDLGHPLRAWRLIFHTNFGSVMGWMVWLYSAYFILLLIELWIAMRHDFALQRGLPGIRGAVARFMLFGKTYIEKDLLERDAWKLRILGSIGIPLAIAFHGSVGAIFGVVGARPYWHSGMTPIMFLVGALASGGALLTFIAAAWRPRRSRAASNEIVTLLGRITLGLVLFDALLEWAEYSVAMWNAVPTEISSVQLILFGPYWWVFWFVHLGLGIIVPVILLIFKGQNRILTGIAGGLVAITFLAVRLNIVVPGLAVEEIKGLEEAFRGPGLTVEYFPSVTEWLLFIWALAMAALVFLIGLRILPVVKRDYVSGGTQ